MPLRHPVKYVYIGHREQGDKGAVRLLRTSGSPRAYALAMTRVLEFRVRVHDNRQTLSLRGRERK